MTSDTGPYDEIQDASLDSYMATLAEKLPADQVLFNRADLLEFCGLSFRFGFNSGANTVMDKLKIPND